MEYEEKIPRSIVVPGDALRFCASAFCGELWSDDDLVALAQEPGEDRFSEEDMRLLNATLKRLARVALPRRGEFVRRLAAKIAKNVAGHLVGIARNAADQPAMKVSTIPGRWLLVGEAQSLQTDLCDAEWIGGLSQTAMYSQWIAGGGCPDLGRLLGVWASQFLD